MPFVSQFAHHQSFCRQVNSVLGRPCLGLAERDTVGVGVGVIHYSDLSPLPGYAGNYSSYNYFSLERASYLQVSGLFTNHLVREIQSIAKSLAHTV